MRSFQLACLLILFLISFDRPTTAAEDFEAAAATRKHKNALLSWTDIKVRYKKRKILHVHPGEVYSGRLLGVLGPSGSGKTTFMNAISSALKTSSNLVVSGDVHMKHGGPIPSDQVAYIYQEDGFFSQLTVKETLFLAAALRLYSNVSWPVIHEVVNYLALDHVSDSFVGDILNRGISGGERKRLSVACEMLGTKPSLIVADEPTSGLDSFQAKQVIHLLRKIAIEKDIAVVCTIHQPRSSIWTLFDDILLLTPLGRVAYHGPRESIMSYFNRIGYSCPPSTNPAEFLIDLVSVDHTTPAATHESMIKHIVTAYSDRHAAAVAMTAAATFNQTNGAQLFAKNDNTKRAILAWLKAPHKIAGSLLDAAFRSGYRFTLLLQRALRQTFRDNNTNLSRVAISSLLAFVIASIYGTDDTAGIITPDSVSNRIGVIANAAINVGMLSTVKALQTFKQERAVVNRERALHRYTSYEYLLSKMFAELPVDAAIGASFGYMLHYRSNLASNRHVFSGILALVSCAASSLGVAIGAMFPRGDTAVVIGPAVMVIYVILGAIGPSGSGNELPNYIKPVRLASPMRWGCEGLLAAEFKGAVFKLLVQDDAADAAIQKTSGGILGGGSRKRRKKGSTGLMGKTVGVLKYSRPILGSIASKLLYPVLSKLGMVDPLAKKMSDGDRVLDRLGIPEASVEKASGSLGRMLVAHTLAALVGLMVSQPKRGH